MKKYSLYYCDGRLHESEVVACLERAWAEIYELEFDSAFGAWRGVHYQAEVDTIHLTWDTMYGGAPLMISISRVTGKIKLNLPREEFLELEEAEIQRLRSLPPGRR